MFLAHWGQKDKGGHVYFMHPIRVSAQLSDIRAKVVALLHDVIEDNDKFNIGHFSFLDDGQQEALKLLTHEKNEEYQVYIEKISRNELARQVKISDLKDNMNFRRLKTITDKDKRRLEKYKKAKYFLENAH